MGGLRTVRREDEKYKIFVEQPELERRLRTEDETECDNMKCIYFHEGTVQW
jgi:hypothetical protein